MNPNGGAIALGHPLGMCGARLALTAAIEPRRARRAPRLCTMCIGVGQGIALDPGSADDKTEAEEMLELKPPRDRDPIEIASRDEIAACRPRGCGGPCATPTRTSRTTGEARRAACTRRPPRAGRPAPVPVHDQGGPARQLSLRHVRRAARAGGADPRLSGTTGKPTVVGYTKRDIDIWADVMARSIRASGGRPGMKVHVAYGYGLFTGGLGAHYGAERLGCTVIPFGAAGRPSGRCS